jgi:hypothetical protein
MSTGFLWEMINNIVGMALSALLILVAMKPALFTKKPDVAAKIEQRKSFLLFAGYIILLFNAVMIIIRISAK